MAALQSFSFFSEISLDSVCLLLHQLLPESDVCALRGD